MRRCSAVDFRSVTEEKDGWMALLNGLALLLSSSRVLIPILSPSIAILACCLIIPVCLSLSHQKVIKIAVAGED